jgi:hypothetical protein
VHIGDISQFNDFCQSIGPLMIIILKLFFPDYSSYTAYEISMTLKRINWCLKSLRILHRFSALMIFHCVMTLCISSYTEACLGYLSEIIDEISSKLYRNFQHKVKLCILSVFSRSRFYCLWMIYRLVLLYF